jgi:hypothetical protein
MADGEETPETLRAEIEHLSRLAKGVTDEHVLNAIRQMVEDLERRARRLEDLNKPSLH